MAGAEVTANDLSRTVSRSLASVTHAARWRDKLKEKAGKLKGTIQPTVEEQESNVSDFLGKTAHTRPLVLGLQIPTNDTLDPASFTPAPTYNRKPPKISKGLTVSFSEGEPEIIGQGGDECEIPAKDVLGSWSGTSSQNAPRLMRKKSTELPKVLSLASPQEFLTIDASTNEKSPLQRAPTRKPVGGWEQKRLSMNMEEGLVQAHKGVETENKVPNEINTSSHTGSPPKSSSHSEQARASLPQLTPPIAVNSAHMIESTSKAYHQSNPGGVNRVSMPPSHSRQFSQSNDINTRGVAHANIDNSATLGQAESDEFYSRVQHLRGVFRLAAEKAVDVESKALEHWLRMSSWWFLRGKTMLERNIRPPAHDTQTDRGGIGHKNHQPYVDLAKAWWSVEEILPDLIGPHSKVSALNTLDKFDGLDYPHLLNTYHDLLRNMKGFAIFLQRSNLMPPPAVLIQGADPSIWIPYPPVAPGILSLTAYLDPRTLMSRVRRGYFPIMFDHTSRHVLLGRAFVEVDVLSHKGFVEAGRLPCLISIFRQRSRPDVELTIVSQDGQVNLHVQHDPSAGPTWTNVKWQNRGEYSLLVDLSKDFQVMVRLAQNDFLLLQGIYNQTQQMEIEWRATEREQILFDSVVPVFHVAGSASNANHFPSIPMNETSIRLFIRTASRTSGATQRSIFDGYRLVARNFLAHSTASCFNLVFAKSTPILCSNLRGENDAPALLLRLQKEQDKPPLILTFRNVEQRSHFHMLVSGVLRFPNEIVSKDIPLLSMSIVELFNEANSVLPVHPLGSYIAWNSLKVISEPRSDGSEQFTLSNSMRISLTANCGSLVDLVNLAAGELQISLEVTDIKSIKVFRPAQDNLIIAFANNMVPKEELRNLQGILDLTAKQSTARAYKFPTLEALHKFQHLVTGFEVIYDGLATAFSISHRRSMIPVHKKQEASGARIQVLSQDNRGQKTLHLLAVLSDFPNGKIMSFQLHGSNVFEATLKSGKHFLRFTDAKFALPKSPENTEMAWDFICLDSPEYPAEHDDIMIGFDTEHERDDLSRVLPAPIKTSRLQSLRR